MSKSNDPAKALEEARQRLDERARAAQKALGENQRRQAKIASQRAVLEQKLSTLKQEEDRLAGEQVKQKRQAKAIQLKTLETKLRAERDAWEKGQSQTAKKPNRMADFTLQPEPKPAKKAKTKSPSRHPYGSDIGGLIDALSPFQDKRGDKLPPIRESKVYAIGLDTPSKDNTKWTRKADREHKRSR